MVRPFPAGQVSEVTAMDRLRMAWRDLRFGSQHRVFNAVPPGHYHSPVPALDVVERRAAELYAPRPDLPGIDLRQTGQLELAAELSRYQPDPAVVDGDGTATRYRTDNAYFHHADGLVYHLLLRHWQPRRIIEVGSGFSTALLLDTADRHFATAPAITAIEPNPQRLRSLLRQQDEIDVIARDVQDVDADLFTSLRAGDVLFIDSSHVAKTGSDVNRLFLEVVPALPAGVFVHVHDMFFPDYPQAFVFGGMAWNEAYLVRALLVGSSRLRIRWWNSYLAACHRDEVMRLLPAWGSVGCSSLWLETC
jgi:predicted O-methyltransferase YrrM